MLQTCARSSKAPAVGKLDVPQEEALMNLMAKLEYVWSTGGNKLEYLKAKYQQKRKEKNCA